MTVTRENKRKPFELSSEYEIKTLILKICANLDCPHRLRAEILDSEVLAVSFPLSVC